jgi:hypothetical protein
MGTAIGKRKASPKRITGSFRWRLPVYLENLFTFFMTVLA